MESSKVRKAYVAGQFYPQSAGDITQLIDSLLVKREHPQDVRACILPHAGYAYSGSVAARTLSAVTIKKKIILIGPNHTGCGQPYSISCHANWQTPLGVVACDRVLAQSILKNSQYLKDDTQAHASEHSLEVQLPLLQYFASDIQIVPLAIWSNELAALKDIGSEIARGIKAQGVERECLLIASTDMTHYESQESAQSKDREAIAAILELSEDKLADKIHTRDISMCGWAPTVVVMACAKALGASKAKLIAYQTSGDVTGDYESVVGYAGVIII